MGMSAGGSNDGLSAEPNVIPMIDIMLVLLIIFMILQPMMRKAIDMQLPDPNPEVQPVNVQSDQIVLEITAANQYRVNTEVVPNARLHDRLKEIFDPRPDKIIFVKAAPTVRFQHVIDAMDVARGAGVKVLGVAPPEN